MNCSGNNRRAFYVVQFIELPFEGIDDYVCVPYTWLVVRRASDNKASVAYPKDEDPFDTRDRVKRKERYDDEWKFYMAAVKYESDTYRDAEYWIATRNDYGPLVEKESTMTDTPSRFTLNKKLRSTNQSNLSKSNNNPRKPLPRISIKRPALSEPKKQLDGKRLRLYEAAQSSSAVVNNAIAMPGCLINDDTPTVVVDDDDKVQPTSIMEQPLFSIQVLSQVASCKPELVQEPTISVTPSMEMTRNVQEVRTDAVINNVSTSHHLPDSLKMSDNLYSHMIGARRLVPIQEPVEKRIHLVNSERNPVIATQNQSNLINQTGSLSTHSVDKQSSVDTQNLLQDGSEVREMHIGNSRDQTIPYRSIAIRSHAIQHVPKIHVKRFHDVADVNPKSEIPVQGFQNSARVVYTTFLYSRSKIR